METAKEHAEELIEEMMYWDTRNGALDAVRSARTCVEKIIEVLDNNEGHWKYQTTSWWREVLTEINNYEV
jgi:hypothetical protein